MAFREVPVFEIREVLRLWLGGEGVRSIARLAQLDRKTVRRFVAAAEAAGVVRGGDVDQLSDGLIGVVCAAVRPARPGGHGVAWELLVPHEELIGGWVGKGLRLTKIADLLARRGVVVPYRTLHRFAVERCGFGHLASRCGWPMVSRVSSVRSTSVGWVCCSTRSPAVGGCCGR
jgi:hypothetical protein